MSHHVTHAAVSAWIAAYLKAWETYDPEDVGALFTEDAEYRWHPADEPEKGRAAIVYGWLNPYDDPSRRDKPGTFEGDPVDFISAQLVVLTRDAGTWRIRSIHWSSRPNIPV